MSSGAAGFAEMSWRLISQHCVALLSGHVRNYMRVSGREEGVTLRYT